MGYISFLINLVIWYNWHVHSFTATKLCHTPLERSELEQRTALLTNNVQGPSGFGSLWR